MSNYKKAQVNGLICLHCNLIFIVNISNLFLFSSNEIISLKNFVIIRPLLQCSRSYLVTGKFETQYRFNLIKLKFKSQTLINEWRDKIPIDAISKAKYKAKEICESLKIKRGKIKNLVVGEVNEKYLSGFVLFLRDGFRTYYFRY